MIPIEAYSASGVLTSVLEGTNPSMARLQSGLTRTKRAMNDAKTMITCLHPVSMSTTLSHTEADTHKRPNEDLEHSNVTIWANDEKDDKDVGTGDENTTPNWQLWKEAEDEGNGQHLARKRKEWTHRFNAIPLPMISASSVAMMAPSATR